MNDPAFIHSAALSANSTGLEVEGLQVDTGARPQKGRHAADRKRHERGVWRWRAEDNAKPSRLGRVGTAFLLWTVSLFVKLLFTVVAFCCLRDEPSPLYS